MLVCPNNRLTVSIGTPLDNKMVVAAECLATLNPVLPSYAETKDATLSLTDLLNKFEIKTNAVEVNRILMEYGFIEHLERKSVSSKNGKKSFWKVSDKGLEFGENAVSPKSPNETRPRWFVSKFPELMKIIGLME